MVLLDAPPCSGVGAGVLESLEALPVDELSASELGVVLESVGLVRGRVDAFEARVLAAFDRLGGATTAGATDTKAWLADRTKVSARDAKVRVRRAKTVEALPALGDALESGAITSGQVDAIGSVVPDKLLGEAAVLVDAAKTSTPEELRQRAQPSWPRPTATAARRGRSGCGRASG